LLFFWQIYGPVTEGLAWTEQLMAMPAADEPTSARGWTLLAAGFLAALRGDFDAAGAFCQEGALIARGIADPAVRQGLANPSASTLDETEARLVRRRVRNLADRIDHDPRRGSV
jgi:hypothetical protein